MKANRTIQDRASARFTQADLTDNTRHAYASDLRHFKHNGGTIPADAEMLRRYLADCAGFYSAATLRRRVMALRQIHVEWGYPSPTDDPKIKAILRGIQKQYGSAQRQAKPLSQDDLRRICKRLTRSPIDMRDKALLLLGFAGAFRRSELVSLDWKDIKRTETGLLIILRESKTHQRCEGRTIAIPEIDSSLCSVKALERWVKAAGIKHGPIFQRLTRSGRPTGMRLDAASVSLIVKVRLTAIGIDAEDYSAHSLRAGLMTEAVKAGVAPWKIGQQTGRKSNAMLSRTIRVVDQFTDNAASAAGKERRK